MHIEERNVWHKTHLLELDDSSYTDWFCGPLFFVGHLMNVTTLIWESKAKTS